MTKVDEAGLAGKNSEVVRVRLLGREYGIKGHGDVHYIQRLADYINEKAESIKRKSGVSSTMDLAILTLLNITDEKFQESGLPERERSCTEGGARSYSSQ